MSSFRKAWHYYIKTQNKVEVIFATSDGEKGAADVRMVTGLGLGALKTSLMATKAAREAYSQLLQDSNFNSPLSFESLLVEDYDGLILPGGHAQGMRPYLESKVLQQFVAEYFDSNRPVGAICHGVVLAARSISRKTGKSVLYDRRTTALPSWMELLAWNLTRLWLGDYYRTYIHLTVEAEVRANLSHKSNFNVGPHSLKKDSFDHPNFGFVVQDGNYLSARWPGDAHNFGIAFLKMIKKQNNQ